MPRDVSQPKAEIIPPERTTTLSHAAALLGSATAADLEQMSLAERQRLANACWTWWILASPGQAKPPPAAVLFNRRGRP